MGARTVQVEPAPGVLSTVMVPWCRPPILKLGGCQHLFECIDRAEVQRADRVRVEACQCRAPHALVREPVAGTAREVGGID
jgi:hypothetical protein